MIQKHYAVDVMFYVYEYRQGNDWSVLHFRRVKSLLAISTHCDWRRTLQSSCSTQLHTWITNSFGIQMWITNSNDNPVAIWKWVGWGLVDIFIFICASLAKTLVLLRPSTTSNQLSQNCRCWLEFGGVIYAIEGNCYYGNTRPQGNKFWIFRWKL